MYRLLLLFSLLHAGMAQELQCHVPGQCSGILVGAELADSYNMCLEQCKANSNCHYATYLGDTGECIEMYDCPTLDPCQNCFSGMVDCPMEEPVCNEPGFCNGHFVAANITADYEDCLEFCKAVEECKWFSYFPDSQQCLLTEDCLFFDDSCANCVAGEKECKIGETEFGHQLFIVGGGPVPANYKVEVINLSGFNRTCPTNMADFAASTSESFGVFIDGHPLVCGGVSDENNGRCSTYDPIANAWNVSDSIILESSREGAAAVLLSQDKWWVTGGKISGSYSRSTEMLTVNVGFAPYMDLPESTNHHSMIKINDTHVMFLGGAFTSATAWMFDTVTETWSPLADKLMATSDGQAGLVTHPDTGKMEVVVVAGRESSTTQIFDIASNTWRYGPTFPGGKLYHGASVPFENTFLVVGGQRSSSLGEDSIYAYRAESESWELLQEKLEVGRYLHAAFTVPDNYIACV